MKTLLTFYSLLFYTDPGSGALLLQLVMGTLIGSLFYFRKIKDKIFRKKPDKKDEKA